MSAQQSRQLSMLISNCFCRFSAAAAERLKSLFVNFTGNIMSEAVTALNQNKEMTKAILLLFYHVFSNDREGFVTTDRFNTLVKPLVELVSYLNKQV